MPIYEFSCRSCGHQFEALVRSSTVPVCPQCQNEDLERLLSLPAVKSDTTRALALRAAKQRDSRQAKERDHAQRQYEASHDD
jgi:putative FmdB family regulatory protein